MYSRRWSFGLSMRSCCKLLELILVTLNVSPLPPVAYIGRSFRGISRGFILVTHG